MAENSGRLREFKGVGANLTRGFGFGNFLRRYLEIKRDLERFFVRRAVAKRIVDGRRLGNKKSLQRISKDF